MHLPTNYDRCSIQIILVIFTQHLISDYCLYIYIYIAVYRIYLFIYFYTGYEDYWICVNEVVLITLASVEVEVRSS